MHKRRNSAIGMMLLELMITLTLSVLIISEFITIYLITNKIHNQQQALHSLTENTRQVHLVLQNIGQQAGCTGRLLTSQPLNGTEDVFTVYFANPIKASDTYRIKATKRRTVAGEPIKALYVIHNNRYSDELVEGIEEMKILYEVQKEGKTLTQSTTALTEGAILKGITLRFIIAATTGITMKKVSYLYLRLQA